MSDKNFRPRLLYAAIAAISLHAIAGTWLVKQASIVTPPQQLATMQIRLVAKLPSSEIAPALRPATRPSAKPKQQSARPESPQHAAPHVARPVAPPATAPIDNNPVDSPAPAVATSEAAVQQTPVAVSAPIFSAAYLNNPAPAYPVSARRRQQQGTTLLAVRVAPDGHPVSVEINGSSGVPELDEAARNAVREWIFVPAKRGTEPIEGSVEVPVRFSIAN